MTYAQSIDWMFSKLPMYQRVGKQAFKKDLTNIQALAKHLKHPEKAFKSIHVAGTNGKGSTSHMLAAVFQEAGYNVGLYTSPHLKDFRERIKVNGKCIRKNSVIHFIKKNKEVLEKQGGSFFEMSEGMAFAYFARKKVDIAIVEVGLGGRLDSTNIIKPLLSVITNIGLDHTQFLGNTLAEIAFEKAGIIKENTPVVIGESTPETQEVFAEIAKLKRAPVFFADKAKSCNYTSDLKGSYQKNNIQTVCQALKLLKKPFMIPRKIIQKGLKHVVKNTGLQGRWQILQHKPFVVCDTAHNKEGLTYTLRQLREQNCKQIHIVIGVVDDKNLEGILPLFPKTAQYYFCQAKVPRALDKQKLRDKAQEYYLDGLTYSSVKEACKAAKKNADIEDCIYIGGSTFVVAEIL